MVVGGSVCACGRTTSVPPAPLAVSAHLSGCPTAAPTIHCFVDCSPARTAQPDSERLVRTVVLRSLAAREFAQVLPADARYRVAQFRLTLLRKGPAEAMRPGGEANAQWLVRGAQAYLRPINSVSQPGDQLQVDVLHVQRKNFCGKVITVPLKRRFVIARSRCLN
jgi:hypothetical protein